MQECASTGKGAIVKRVTVRSGGAGHAHSGVARTSIANRKRLTAKETNSKIVKLGR